MRFWKELSTREHGFALASLVFFLVAVGSIIGWLNSYPPMETEWSAVAGLATAVGTFLLACFAWAAWRAALGTIKTQTNSDQISALAEYVRALNSLSRIPRFSYPNYPPDQYFHRDHLQAIDNYKARLLELTQQVESAATIWRAHHKTVGGDMAAFAEAEHFLIESIEWWHDADAKCPQEAKQEQHRLWTEFAKALSRIATHWQVNEQERLKNANRVAGQLDRYLAESPLLPDSLDGYGAIKSK